MKSLRIALPLVLVITQDMSAMSAMCGRLNQFSAYARQTAQRMMATNQSLSFGSLQQPKSSTIPQLQYGHSFQYARPLTTTSLLQRQSVQPLQTQVIQQPEYMQQNSQYNEQTFAQRLMGFMQRYRTALSVGTLFGLGGYAISQQDPVLAEEPNLDLDDELFARVYNRSKNDDSDLAEIQDLITRGANVNSLHKRRWSPLMCAAARGDICAAKMLLEAGADVNFMDPSGDTPLKLAIQDYNVKMVEVLVTAGAGSQELKKGDADVVNFLWKLAIQKNLVDCVQIFIETGANVNNPKAYQWVHKPLLFACAHGRTEIIKKLIEAGADVNDEYQNATALMIAVFYNRSDAVKTLLQAGANVNAENKKGETALSIAKEKNSTEIIKLLEEYGATK